MNNPRSINQNVSGALTTIHGESYYTIAHTELMEPFLISVVSDSDLWMWISSNATLTAGRIDANHALFPYLTDDRIHRSVGHCGPITVIAHQNSHEWWCPFASETAHARSISKHIIGNRIFFEEYHADWKVRYRAGWAPAAHFGWVREVELINEGPQEIQLDIIDGLLDIMPAGLDALTEQSFSNLADAYKRAEYASVATPTTAALYTLESRISDRAEPGESLTATLVWSAGQPFAELHLDERILVATQRGHHHPPAATVVGRPTAYLLKGPQTIPPSTSIKWAFVADTNLDHRTVHARLHQIDQHGYQVVTKDIAEGSARLAALLAAADGFHTTGDAVADTHHLSNVLFNCMRGGVFPHEYRIPVADLLDFLQQRNSMLSQRYAASIEKLGEWTTQADVIALARAQHDYGLERLVLEYLPLAFSRRHGDPSRPWNNFSIHLRNRDGKEMLSYEGNWRDIFQNWEALLYSFPSYTAHVVAKFLNASTVDGYNPYRINRAGIDWEVPDPTNPWSNIGYWGDHQIIYLLRLLEAWERFEPDALLEWVNRPLFSYANLPYQLASHAAMLKNPRATITYDQKRATTILNRVEKIGGDGRLVVDAKGAIVQVGLLEKLMVSALAKLTAFVPQGGIWMNTQRPEWNDANNALTGYGLSMVTCYYVRRYLAFIRALLARGDTTLQVSRVVVTWMEQQYQALKDYHTRAPDSTDHRQRRWLMDTLGTIGEHYRSQAYASFDATPTQVARSAVAAWCEVAIQLLDTTIETARRSGGLYHSYNIINFSSNTATLAHLAPMLEGQVAALSSGKLSSSEAADLLEALAHSELYRADQRSFTLYPTRMPLPFLQRNILPPDTLQRYPALKKNPNIMGSILLQDEAGAMHFHPALINAAALQAMLATSQVTSAERTILLDLYEATFHHHSYTGRSGTMHGYEGIGSIYWHMVGKLLLAAQECYWEAQACAANPEIVARLRHSYLAIRAGLGFRKDPAHFGAFPTDCYSHTPAHSGAQQPGMTGQVKEGILCRWGELGLRIHGGAISLELGLLPDEEYFPSQGNVTFTFCGTTFEVRRSKSAGTTTTLALYWQNGEHTTRQGNTLSVAESVEIFHRSGAIQRVGFTVG